MQDIFLRTPAPLTYISRRYISMQKQSLGPFIFPSSTFSGFGTSVDMYYDTTLQEAFSRGLKCHSNDLSKSVNLVRLMGRYLQEDYNSIFYGKAQNLGRVLCKAYDEALQKYDVLLLPTITRKAAIFPPANPSMKGKQLPRVWIAVLESLNLSPFLFLASSTLVLNLTSQLSVQKPRNFSAIHRKS